MSMLQLVVSSPVQAHQAVNDLYQGVIKPHTRTGAQGVITWQTMNSWLREKHRAAFHGYILDTFAEGVWFTDADTGLPFRFSKPVWKHYLKTRFLAPKVEEYVDKHGEVKFRELPLSTESLSDDEYSEFLMAVQAFAVCDLGLDFPEEGY